MNPAEATKFRIYAQRQSDGMSRICICSRPTLDLRFGKPCSRLRQFPQRRCSVFCALGKPLEEGIDVTPLWAREDTADAP